MSNVVLGVFGNGNAAIDAVRELREGGFPVDHMSLVGGDSDDLRSVASHMVKVEPDKMMTAFTIAGAIGGFVVGLFSVSIPGTGDMVLAAPAMAAVAGATAGGCLGAVVGALVHFDVPEYEGKIYRGQVTVGTVLLALETNNRAERFRAEEIMESCGATEVDAKVAA